MPLSGMSDHDLIVRLDTKLDGLQEAITDIKTLMNTKVDSYRVEVLEKDFEKLGESVGKLGKSVWMILGGAVVVEFAVNLLVHANK